MKSPYVRLLVGLTAVMGGLVFLLGIDAVDYPHVNWPIIGSPQKRPELPRTRSEPLHSPNPDSADRNRGDGAGQAGRDRPQGDRQLPGDQHRNPPNAGIFPPSRPKRPPGKQPRPDDRPVPAPSGSVLTTPTVTTPPPPPPVNGPPMLPMPLPNPVCVRIDPILGICIERR